MDRLIQRLRASIQMINPRSLVRSIFRQIFSSVYLEPGDPVEHLKDHVALLHGTQLELLHHLLDIAAADLNRLTQDRAVLHQLPASKSHFITSDTQIMILH